MQSLDTATLIQVAYALGIGLLMGMERAMEATANEPSSPADTEDEENSTEDGEDEENSENLKKEEEAADAEGEKETLQAKEDPEVLGVRTFSIVSLLGYVAASLGALFEEPIVAAVGFAAVGALVVTMYTRTKDLGITTESALIAACGLGMLCRFKPELAGVLAVVITVLLAAKRFTHKTVRQVRRVELTDTLKFLVVILIVLPLLPNRALDPYEAFNPFKVGLLVVLVSGISYVGYFLTRLFGARRGLTVAGILGGLTSSTAVTAAMADQAKERPEWRRICAAATVAANATMFVRVLLVVAVLDGALATRLLWSVGGMAVTAILASVILWLRSRDAEQEGSGAQTSDKLKNPFSLGPALKFGAFFVFVIFVVKLAQASLGDSGLYGAAALSGLADVDAITLSLGEQTAAGQVGRRVAAIAITIAVVSNSVVKTGISIYSGGWGFGRVVGACLGLATVVGLGLALIV